MDDPFQLSDETLTMEHLRQRTRELAALKGRAAHEVTQEDYEAAKRDLAANPRPWTPRRAPASGSPSQEGNVLGQGVVRACLVG